MTQRRLREVRDSAQGHTDSPRGTKAFDQLWWLNSCVVVSVEGVQSQNAEVLSFSVSSTAVLKSEGGASKVCLCQWGLEVGGSPGGVGRPRVGVGAKGGGRALAWSDRCEGVDTMMTL